jgi:hypothetical protein
MNELKGQPPNMMVAVNVTTTIAIVHIMSIGTGGFTLAPTTARVAAPPTAPTRSVLRISRSPLIGWGREAANSGFLQPQAMPITISIGMTDMRQKETQVMNFGASKREMKPIETAMTNAEAAMPAKQLFEVQHVVFSLIGMPICSRGFSADGKSLVGQLCPREPFRPSRVECLKFWPCMTRHIQLGIETNLIL